MTNQSTPLDLIRFPLHGIRLIEASAGTGKTYSIAALYLRLVLGHGRDGHPGLTPPDILVLTFTRAATQELRDRIRQRLTQAAAAFRGTASDSDEFIGQLLAEYPHEEHEACARRLQVAADWMDEAAIHTIHAWCQTMLRQHAFDSGSLFAQDVDSEDRELFDQVVKDYWRRHFYNDLACAEELQEFATGPASLAATVRKLIKPGLIIQHNGETIEGLTPQQVSEEIEAWRVERDRQLEPVREGWRARRSEIVALFESAVARGALISDFKKESVRNAWFAELDDWAKGGTTPVETLKNFTPGGIRKRLSKKAGTIAPVHDWFDKVRTLEELPSMPDIHPLIWPHAVDWVRSRYQAEKRNRNRLDFDDLLIQLDQALAGDRGEVLRRRILQKFPVALIDEFQDTDPVQYRIFERVYLPERDDPKNALIMIGDPKQSIYSFRGADIHTYLAARSRTTTEDRFTLKVNHRSTRSMVEAVNRLFEAGNLNPGRAFGFATEDDDPIPFEQVSARGRAEQLEIGGAQASALTFWYQPPKPGQPEIAKKAHQPLMASLTANQIVDLINGSRREDPDTGFRQTDGIGTLEPIQPSDIAILVNGRFEAAEIQKALRQRGLGSVYLSDRDSAFDQPEAIDILAILEAAARPLDDQRVRSALASTSACMSVRELEAVSRDEGRLESEIALFQRLGHIWQHQGVLAMLRQLLSEKSIPARLRKAGPDWERRLTNILHLAELLQAESAHRDGPQGLIDWLHQEIARKNRSENDSEIIRLESDADLIRIITVHKSKGLQYPIVFVPFASCYFGGSSGPFLTYHDDEGNRIAELDTEHPIALERSRQERVQERIRLLYVALTRAEHACWVGVAPVNNCEDAGPNRLLAGLARSLDEGGSSGLHEALVHLASASPQIAVVEVSGPESDFEPVLPEDSDFACEPAMEYPARSHEPWWIASYSALRYGDAAIDHAPPESAMDANLGDLLAEGAEDSQDPAPLLQRASKPESIHSFHRGAKAGTLLHDLLEWAGNRGFGEALEDEAILEDQIRSRLTARDWQDQTPTIKAWLIRQLKNPMRLGQDSVRLIDLPPGRHRYRCELSFLLEAKSVDVARVDALVIENTVDARPRPAFRPDSLNGMLTGFIDLVFEHEGRWYIADYKSNHLGPDQESYSSEAMAEAILDKRYDLQYVLYTLALHRLLRQRLGSRYRPADHLGGSVYLFLRGCDNEDTAGVFYEPANIALIEKLDRLFAGEELVHVA